MITVEELDIVIGHLVEGTCVIGGQVKVTIDGEEFYWPAKIISRSRGNGCLVTLLSSIEILWDHLYEESVYNFYDRYGEFDTLGDNDVGLFRFKEMREWLKLNPSHSEN